MAKLRRPVVIDVEVGGVEYAARTATWYDLRRDGYVDDTTHALWLEALSGETRFTQEDADRMMTAARRIVAAHVRANDAPVSADDLDDRDVFRLAGAVLAINAMR